MNTTIQRLEALFAEAVAVPPTERATLLDRACAGDAALRARVESLLRASAALGGFLETAVVPGVTEASAGARIGRYRLLEKIGEGGVGTVFMAEQEEPVRRKVAVKVIKPGMDSREVIARFESERQALALMDHPNIARVLDAGATERGRPFFVMELVRGIRITDYCDQNQLSTGERLKLFLPVCSAIQHAHQKGVIHRDIKPSNTLVTLHDGVPVPKVIDFGIAKATQGRLTDRTLFTSFAQFIGTPAYMSPEQAEMSGLDVDTRTDVYSLGVLLYELLTGRTPFDAKELSSVGIDEVRKRIRDSEPPRLSTRLHTLGDEALTVAAKNRRADPAKLVHELRGDLEWIVGRCLEKDRARRYETANALAADLQRHLANEPVVARPPSAAYRLQKFLARNRLAVAATAAIALSLVGGLALAMEAFFRERAARQRAVVAEQAQSALRREAEEARNNEAKLRALAEMEAVRGAKVTASLQSVLAGIGPRMALGRNSVRDFLAQAERQVNSELRHEPEVLAAMHEALGRNYHDIGDSQRAADLHRSALTVRRQRLGDDHPDTIASMDSLGVNLNELRKFSESERLLRTALDSRRQLWGEDHPLVATSLHHLSLNLESQARNEESLALRTQALALRRRLLGGEHPEVAESLWQLARLMQATGRHDESLPLFREAIAMQRKLLGPDHPDLADALSTFGRALDRHGPEGVAEAIPLLREAVSIRRKVYGSEHPSTMGLISDLADMLRRAKKPSEAEVYLREWLASWPRSGARDVMALEKMKRRLNEILPEERQSKDKTQIAALWESLEKERAALGPDHPQVLAHMSAVAKFYWDSFLLSEAVALAEETLARQRRVVGANDPATIKTMLCLGRCYINQRRFGDAAVLLEEAIANAAGGPDVEPRDVDECRVFLGNAYLELGEIDRARSLSQSLLKMEMAKNNEETQVNARRYGMGRVELRAGNYAAAEQLFRTTLEHYLARDPERFPRYGREAHLGLAIARQGRFDEAEPMLVRSCEWLLAHWRQANLGVWPHYEDVIAALAELYATHGQPEKAAVWKERAALARNIWREGR